MVGSICMDQVQNAGSKQTPAKGRGRYLGLLNSCWAQDTGFSWTPEVWVPDFQQVDAPKLGPCVVRVLVKWASKEIWGRDDKLLGAGMTNKEAAITPSVSISLPPSSHIDRYAQTRVDIRT